MHPKTPDIVAQLADAIRASRDYSGILDPVLASTLRGICLYPNYQAEMTQGQKRLPPTSAALLDMGVFYVSGRYIALHPVLVSAFEDQQAKRDALLERLEQYHRNIKNGVADSADFSSVM